MKFHILSNEVVFSSFEQPSRTYTHILCQSNCSTCLVFGTSFLCYKTMHLMSHVPLYDVLAAPARVLLNLHLALTKHLWQLGEKPLVPLDRALKLPERDREGGGRAQLNASVGVSKSRINVPCVFICYNLDLSCPILCEIPSDRLW